MFGNKSAVSPALNLYALYFLRGMFNKKEEKKFFGKKPITYD